MTYLLTPFLGRIPAFLFGAAFFFLTIGYLPAFGRDFLPVRLEPDHCGLNAGTLLPFAFVFDILITPLFRVRLARDSQ
jgi:hypothetical protein